ncbi:hypothetical protein OSTOST_10243 [Ostertagia ostertagi]
MEQTNQEVKFAEDPAEERKNSGEERMNQKPTAANRSDTMNTFIIVFAIAGVALCHPGAKGGPGGEGGPTDVAGRGRHHGPPPPPFLKNVTEEARKEFFAIVFNKDEKIADQKKNVLTWAKKYGVEVQEFNTNMTNIANEVRKNVTELINALPAADEDNPAKEMVDAIKALSAGNPKVYRVLMFVLREFKPKRGGPRGQKGGPRGPKGGDCYEGPPITQKRSLAASQESVTELAFLAKENSEIDAHQRKTSQR